MAALGGGHQSLGSLNLRAPVFFGVPNWEVTAWRPEPRASDATFHVSLLLSAMSVTLRPAHRSLKDVLQE